jgi:hypothetical protein
MSDVSVMKSAVLFTRNGVTTFSAIGAIIPAETRLLGSRVGLGHAVLSGIARVTAAAPGIVPGTLLIEQSVDSTNWELTNSYSMLPATGAVPFSIRIVATYIRARFGVDATEVMDLRFGASIRPNE